MIHPATKLEFISQDKGYGVIATEFIPRGTITWAQDGLDQILSNEDIRNLGSNYNGIITTYSFRNNNGDYVLCWDHGKYVNHSFNSNCLTTPYNFEIAIRDILPGEELTDDYGYLNIEAPFRGIEENTKRKVVYPDDILTYAHEWDGKIQESFKFFKAVRQPLYRFLPDDIRTLVNEILLGNRQPDSIKNCYYDSNNQAH